MACDAAHGTCNVQRGAWNVQPTGLPRRLSCRGCLRAPRTSSTSCSSSGTAWPRPSRRKLPTKLPTVPETSDRSGNFRPFRKLPTRPSVSSSCRAAPCPGNAYRGIPFAAGAPPALAGVECGKTWRQRGRSVLSAASSSTASPSSGCFSFGRTTPTTSVRTKPSLARSLRPSPLPRRSTLHSLHAARVLPSPFTPARMDGR